jgi:hypothetical protein
MLHLEPQEQAIKVAREIANDYGFESTPRVLRDANNQWC